MTNPSPIQRPPSEEADSTWLEYLTKRLDKNWRDGEWDEQLLRFTADVENPLTITTKCPVVACPALVESIGLCMTCRRIWETSGIDISEFTETFTPAPTQMRHSHEPPGQCRAWISGTRCPQQGATREVCRTHYMQWVKRNRSADQKVELDHWLEHECNYLPAPKEVVECRMDKCESVVMARGLCQKHHQAFWSSQFSDIDQFIQGYVPRWRAGEFSLANVREPLRSELLIVLQQRDRDEKKLYPSVTRKLIECCSKFKSITQLDESSYDYIVNFRKESNYRSIARDAVRIVTNEYVRAMGIDPIDCDVIDTIEAGFNFTEVETKVRRYSAHQLDLRQISQDWIRNVYREWLKEKVDIQEPTEARFLTEMLSAGRAASSCLAERNDQGVSPTALGLADMRAIVKAFSGLRKKDGELYAESVRRYRLSLFKQLIEFGRSRGHLPSIHNGFADGPGLAIPPDDSYEEKKARAIPEVIIRQLDEHLPTFDSRARPGADLDPDFYSECLRTVYKLLRDTGRRPAEIYGLRYDCLRTEGETSVLIWDNRKGKRFNRRLPILRSTRDVILDWKTFRTEHGPDWWTDDYLFPPVYKKTNYKHFQTFYFSPCFRQWTQDLRALDTSFQDIDGKSINFPRENIFAYGFRHAYAQRLVDAGIPIETVRDLMDHKDITTTQVYFTVRDESKRKATEVAARYTVDKGGSPVQSSGAGFALESVSIPYGRCVNPSNVKAGGHGCPIRFQCTGCPDFRSDPSYLPQLKVALHEKLGDLLESEELGAEQWIVDASNAEVKAYRRVVRTLEDIVENLGDAERSKLDQASNILNDVNRLNLIPIEVIRSGQQKY